ncbi:hypothetical protein [Caulobacter sp.]|uniref:hypothetical protein n=1 Tax=Caulobacter sp. TaxID=78 RepID=UPI003BB01B74
MTVISKKGCADEPGWYLGFFRNLASRWRGQPIFPVAEYKHSPACDELICGNDLCSSGQALKVVPFCGGEISEPPVSSLFPKPVRVSWVVLRLTSGKDDKADYNAGFTKLFGR